MPAKAITIKIVTKKVLTKSSKMTYISAELSLDLAPTAVLRWAKGSVLQALISQPTVAAAKLSLGINQKTILLNGERIGFRQQRRIASVRLWLDRLQETSHLVLVRDSTLRTKAKLSLDSGIESTRPIEDSLFVKRGNKIIKGNEIVCTE